MLKVIALIGTFLLSLAPLTAQGQTTSIQVDHVWARASTGQTGAVYMTIANKGPADDRLVSAATPVAGQVQLHTEINDNGIMKMRPVPGIDVKSGGQTTLGPGGFHVMLIGLKQPLKEGESFPLTLTFENAGKLDVSVKVEKAGSMGGMRM
jgi:periplasmic copper chaperone A